VPALAAFKWPERRRPHLAGQTPDGTAPAHENATEGGDRPGRPGRLAPDVIGRRWLVAGLVACAVYAGGVALLSSSVVERPWGLIAAPCYALSAVVAALWRRRGTDAALALSLAGGLAAPLGWLAARGVQQREVNVIARGAWLLLHHGTPYRSVAMLAHTQNPDAYNPYLPAMEVFALARAVWGDHPLTDPRIWFAVAFIVVFWLALRVTGTRRFPGRKDAPRQDLPGRGDALRQAGRWTVLVAATPVFAFPLAVSGDDVPVVGLICLGLALLAQHDQTHPAGTQGGPGGTRPVLAARSVLAGRPALAGVVLGIATAMKATAWPAVLIAAVLVATRDGRRPAARFVAAVLATLAVLIGPVAAVSPSALTDNTIAFPLGLASVKSGAVSPLPGVLLSQSGHAGHLIATGLLALAGLAVLVSLVIRPPRTVRAATWWLIVALVLMFTLAPSTRFGYYIYPLGLWIWLCVAQPKTPSTAPHLEAAEGRIPLCG
jgi:Glycosyltransferase family 87